MDRTTVNEPNTSFSLSDSLEVFNYLVKPQENWTRNLLAFAIFEQSRFEWMVHEKNNNGAIPTDNEIRKWYSRQPESTMIRAKTDADNALASFTEEAIDSAISADQDNFRKSEVMAEINKVKKEVVDEVANLGKIGPQFWKNIFFSVLGYGMFTILSLIAIIYMTEHTILDLIEFIFRGEIKQNGKAE